jgi:hypothetical protein
MKKKKKLFFYSINNKELLNVLSLKKIEIPKIGLKFNK